MARRKNKDHGDMLYATDRYATAFLYVFLKDDGTAKAMSSLRTRSTRISLRKSKRENPMTPPGFNNKNPSGVFSTMEDPSFRFCKPFPMHV